MSEEIPGVRLFTLWALVDKTRLTPHGEIDLRADWREQGLCPARMAVTETVDVICNRVLGHQTKCGTELFAMSLEIEQRQARTLKSHGMKAHGLEMGVADGFVQ